MNCEIYRQQMMDLTYGEGEMNQDLEKHLEKHLEICADCAEFWANLHQVKDLLGELTPPEESGFREVKGVLLEVYQIEERRRLVFDLIKFGGVTVLIFSLYFLLYRWQGHKGLLITYLAMYLIFPLALIPIYKFCSKKEEAEW